MDLKLAYSNASPEDLYSNQLAESIKAYSADLLDRDVWDKEFVEAAPYFVNEHIGVNNPVDFTGIPKLLILELKLYWARLLSDRRNNSRSITERRRLPMKWFRKEGPSILRTFDVSCLADIDHPEFPVCGHTSSVAKRQHNQDLLARFAAFGNNSKRAKVAVETVKSGELNSKDYTSPRISILGDFHKKVVIQREQFQPLKKRNIIFLNDIYSEEDVRFKDTQRQADQYLNAYLFPKWLRPAVKEHVLQKVTHGELAPKTLTGYFGRLGKFRDFMHEQFSDPTPECITDNLIEDQFVAWGNSQGYVGKNWFTDAVAMLNTAARTWPDQWPALSVSNRAAKKIEKVHYKKGLGRIGHNQESAGRAYSQNTIDAIRDAVRGAPEPIEALFGLILGTGIRSEDGHAILFDCLADDPSDKDFMLLTFWQNKTSKWNVKPLHKPNPAHAELISIIEAQRERVLNRYGKPTKYLFPIFTGTNESFIVQSYSLNEIKRLCLKRGVQSDDGTPLSFTWHPLRHTKGTSLAKDGHDILSIMMELGHTSPDMATVYINNRLELKKKALLENGGGRFYTIEGKVDSKVSELLVRKDQISATRVCGGACAMPSQLGDWCEHANACYTCKHYRADAKDVDFFKGEQASISHLIEEQQEEALLLSKHGRERMAKITERRLSKNKGVYKHLDKIINAIELDGHFQGDSQQCKKQSLEEDQ